jgi:hypothetical protein
VKVQNVPLLFIQKETYCRRTIAYPDVKNTRFSMDDDVSPVLHMVTVAKTAEIVAVSKLPPCVCFHACLGWLR